jgi:hypothetical protein
LNSERILERCARAADLHGRATDEGNFKVANRAYDRAARAFAALRKTSGYEKALLSLLDHLSPHVRAWAATRLLPTHETQATRTLEQVGQGRGFMAFSARITLELWKKGELKLP